MSSGPTWSRRRAQLAVVGSLALLLAVAVGAALRIATAHPHTDAPTIRPVSPGEHLQPADQLAAAPLPTAELNQALPAPLSTQATTSIELPTASELGPAGVPTGYPQTEAGALAQLAAIDIAALGGGTIAQAQEIIAGWAAPGGPTEENWSGVRALAAMLSAAGLTAEGDPSLTLRVTAPMGLIKGRIGPDFVIPCLDLLVTATLGGRSQSVAVADCQRMAWRAGRWVIGAGAEPAPAPSLWPGTRAAFDAGYRPLVTAAAVPSRTSER